MVKVSRGDLEGLVEDVDGRVRAAALSWKTALNVWALVSRAFSDACRSNLDHARVILHRAIDDEGTETSRKEEKALRVPIEAPLIPLLCCAS